MSYHSADLIDELMLLKRSRIKEQKIKRSKS
jgi:hypothetical protein